MGEMPPEPAQTTPSGRVRRAWNNHASGRPGRRADRTGVATWAGALDGRLEREPRGRWPAVERAVDPIESDRHGWQPADAAITRNRKPIEAGAHLSSNPQSLVPSLPTPVTPLHIAGTRGLWMKNDGASASPYGGNKIRKLAILLPDALNRGARRLLTVGAAGSHHALATALYGKRAGLEVSALLAPQLHTEHAERTFLAALGVGLEVLPLPSVASVADALRRVTRKGDYWIGPGAMGAMGAMGYTSAARELWHQVESGALPEPDRLVVAVGSGSTAAGLLVGLADTPLSTRVVGVQTAKNPTVRSVILAQACLAARREHLPIRLREWSQRLELRSDVVGAGYGVPCERGVRATQNAASAGLKLDPTYTAKAFAIALELGRTDTAPTLYWHTLSSAPLEPLLASAPKLEQLPARLRHLLRPNTLGDPPKSTGSE